MNFGYIRNSIVAFFLLVSLFVIGNAKADDVQAKPDKLPVTWGGFVDTYYAYDFNNPMDHERAYVSQAKRSNEFNINLAYLEAKVSADQVRGRLALQTGTSVQANYAGEPTLGQTSGPSLSRSIQEAVVGYRITDHLWVDAGIYYSHIGFEGWNSKDNWNYTRSLDAEFTPYYQSGVKATYQWTNQLSTQLNVINGWQNISENNGNKAVGFQAAYTPSQFFSLTYNNFYGQEANTSGLISPRFFNQVIGTLSMSQAFRIATTFDLGSQKKAGGGGDYSYWHNLNLLGRYQVGPTLAFGMRCESYVDKDQVIVATGNPHGFDAWGASFNADFQLHPAVLLRTEIRRLWATDSIFPGKVGPSSDDGWVVASLSLNI